METNKLKAFATSPELAILTELAEVNEKLEKISSVLNGIDLSKVESLKGDSPEKGKDYFTDEELEQIQEIIKAETTPVKGLDYFDGETPDIEEIIKEVIKRINK